MLVTLAEALGITPGAFWEDVPGVGQRLNSEADEAVQILANTSGAFEALRYLARMSPRTRDAALLALRQMCGPDPEAAASKGSS